MSAGAVAKAGMARKIGAKSSEMKKRNAVVSAVRPVRPPSATPEADSTKVVTVEVPKIAPKEVAMESESNAPRMRGNLPSLSSILALVETPMRVPMVSKMSTNMKANMMMMKLVERTSAHPATWESRKVQSAGWKSAPKT